MTTEPLWKQLGLEDPDQRELRVLRTLTEQLAISQGFSFAETIEILIDRRRTGKTTRIMLQALQEAIDGKSVIIRVHAYGMLTFVQSSLITFLDTLSVKDPKPFNYYLNILNRITILVGTKSGSELHGQGKTLVLDDEPKHFR